MDVKFPTVKVKLVGENGNAFAIMGRVVAAMRKAKVSTEAIEEYKKAATASDHDNLLRVTMKTVDTE